MIVKELKKDIQKFRDDLREYRDLWAKSLDRTIPDYPVCNNEELEKREESLNLQKGRLGKYLYKFGSWTASSPMVGSFNILNEAIAGNSVAIIRGKAMDMSISQLTQILGKLDSMGQDEELGDRVKDKSEKEINIDLLMSAYLDHLHPAIINSRDLFLVEHFSNSVVESIRELFLYIGKKSNQSGDGADLVNVVFSEKKPILKFGDLQDETARNMQIGFMDMLKGYYKGVRSPLSHPHEIDIARMIAFEYLVMSSLFCRRIDEAVK